MTDTSISQRDFLKASGTFLRNNYGNGSIVRLRGINAGGYLIQEFWMTPTKQSKGNYKVNCENDIYKILTRRFGKENMSKLVKTYQANYFTTKDFDNCQQIGINCIRLPFWYRNFVDIFGNFIEGCFELFDWFIDQARQRGIYVILDFHGAPGSQNGSNHSGISREDKKYGSEFFFGQNTSNNQKLYYEIWHKIAEHYAGNPTVAGYDLLNEPFCTWRYENVIPDSELHSMLWDIYDHAFDVIRSVDHDHVIIMEAVWNASDLPNPCDYGWDNVMYEYHNYLYKDNSPESQISNMQKKFDGIKEKNYDVPSYLGEFNYFAELKAWDQGLRLINDFDINWTMWSYKVTRKNKNWGLYIQDTPMVNVAIDSFEKIEEKWSRVGDSQPNSELIEIITKYFKESKSEEQLEAGEIYIKSSYNGKIVCSDDQGNPLVANRMQYGGSFETFDLIISNDGSISLKSRSNNKYVSARINKNNQLQATADENRLWEKFYLLKVNKTEFSLKSCANNMFICVNYEKELEKENVVLYANSSFVDNCSKFTIFKPNGTQILNEPIFPNHPILMNDQFCFKSNLDLIVTARDAGKEQLEATSTNYASWETFTIINNDDGTISFKSHANGKYVCTHLDDDNKLIALSTEIYSWEKFNVERISPGKFAFKSIANQKYVTADQSKGNALFANVDIRAGWEAFTIYAPNGFQFQ